MENMNKAPKEIMDELHQKFVDNFAEWKKIDDSRLERIFIGLQCVAATGEILKKKNKSKHHLICCKIYDEIFSDGVSAIYLASNAMNKPANIVLRRILELGVATLYLWDMPHITYSWSRHDHDLSFSEMLKHINSIGYIAYLNGENSKQIDGKLLPEKRLQSIYGDLSDVVHGKITTFESSMPDRFKFVESEWQEFVALIDEVVCLIVKASIARHDISSEIINYVPLAKKELRL